MKYSKLKIVIMCFVLAILALGVKSYATDEDVFNINIDCEENENTGYVEGDIITLDINIDKIPEGKGINVLSFILNIDNKYLQINEIYDEDIEENVLDIKGYKNWKADFDNESKSIVLTRTDLYSMINENICKIKLKVNKQFEKTNIEISEIEAAGGASDNFVLENKSIEIDAKSNQSVEDIYLSSTAYKIGFNDIEKYEVGDQNLYRVSPNTKIQEFLNNLSTNGNISVYNADGEEETNMDELIKTGMTIKVTKEGCESITLTISVTGDLNEDGIEDITDLVKIRQYIQEIIIIDKKEIELAADINEDQLIDITDLVKIRQYIQQVEDI